MFRSQAETFRHFCLTEIYLFLCSETQSDVLSIIKHTCTFPIIQSYTIPYISRLGDKVSVYYRPSSGLLSKETVNKLMYLISSTSGMNRLPKIFKFIINEFNTHYVTEIARPAIESVQFNLLRPYAFPPTYLPYIEPE